MTERLRIHRRSGSYESTQQSARPSPASPEAQHQAPAPAAAQLEATAQTSSLLGEVSVGPDQTLGPEQGCAPETGSLAALGHSFTDIAVFPQPPSTPTDDPTSLELGEGTPLSAPQRSLFQPLLGYDLSAVRLHADGEASEAARTLRAAAFTVGHDIGFGAGRYAPDTPTGSMLLAHELAHVVQQNGSSEECMVPVGLGTDPAEVEARSATSMMIAGVPPTLTTGGEVAIRRAEEDNSWMGTATKFWGGIKESMYQSLIEGMRGLQRRGIAQLYALVADMTPVQRAVAELIIAQVEIVSDILISLVLAVVGLGVGLLRGIANALWGLLKFVYGVLEMLVLFVAGLFSAEARETFDERAHATIAGLKNLGPALRALADRWLAEFRAASPDRQTLMIGELTGEIEAILATALAGGSAASKFPKLSLGFAPARQLATATGAAGAAGAGGAIALDVAGPGAAVVATSAMATSVNERAGSGNKQAKAAEREPSGERRSSQESGRTETEEVPQTAEARARGAAVEVNHIERHGYRKLPNWFKTLDATEGGTQRTMQEGERLVEEYSKARGISVKSTYITDPEGVRAIAEAAAQELKDFKSYQRTEGGLTVRVRDLSGRELHLIFDEQAVFPAAQSKERELLRALSSLEKDLGGKGVRFKWWVYRGGREYAGPKFFKDMGKMLDDLPD